MISTILTQKLSIRAPVISAPLGRGSTPAFVAAVNQAGAFPFLALMHMTESEVDSELARYIAAVGDPWRLGINLTLIKDQHPRLDIALARGIRVVSLWYGDPAPYITKVKSVGGLVFWTVGSPSEASRARDLGVDFIVCQGREAGGHLVGQAPIMSLLPAVVDAAKGVPVVAAGGIADGRGLAAAMTLGAVGVWMGTRFVASQEAANHPSYKEKIVVAEACDIEETRLFDGGWPDAPHRIIRNSTLTRWEDAGRPPSGRRPGEGERIGSYPDGAPFLRYTDASPWDGFDGDWEAGPHYAGSSAQLVRSIEPVNKIVLDMVGQAEAALQAARSKVTT